MGHCLRCLTEDVPKTCGRSSEHSDDGQHTDPHSEPGPGQEFGTEQKQAESRAGVNPDGNLCLAFVLCPMC